MKQTDDKISGRMDTVLAQWLRKATPAQRQALADGAKTSVGYLRLLAGVHRENPKLRLAMAIVEQANKIPPDGVTGVPLPIINLEDLAIPTRYKGKQ